MKKLWENEPVAVINAVATILALLISLAVAFNAPLDESQKGQLLIFVNGVAAVLATLLGRAQVTPMAKVEQISPSVARRIEEGEPGHVDESV